MEAPATLAPEPEIVVCDDCGRESPRHETQVRPSGFRECFDCKGTRIADEKEAYMRASGRSW